MRVGVWSFCWLFVVCCMLRVGVLVLVVWRVLSFVCCLSVVGFVLRSLFFNCVLLLLGCWLSLDICCLLFVDRWLEVVVYCSLFGV